MKIKDKMEVISTAYVEWMRRCGRKIGPQRVRSPNKWEQRCPYKVLKEAVSQDDAVDSECGLKSKATLDVGIGPQGFGYPHCLTLLRQMTGD